jgi:vacuolar-type H+-ATPase subunit H
MPEATGVSQSYVDSRISSLHSQLLNEIHSVRNELHREISNAKSELHREIESARNEFRREIERLEQEMIEVGRMIVGEIRDQTARLSGNIETQTVAVVGGVAATTVMLERTKNQIETDFDRTRTKLDLQTEASLQIEVGKKIADSVSTHGKLMAFASDINSRFQKSIEGIFLNRQLYSVNFNKIFDEYRNKIRTIGEHIFYIRDNDILPAVKAANASLEEIHGLPFEVDLLRLKVRAQSLDETLTMLKQSRFDQILNSLDNLTESLNSQFALDLKAGSSNGSDCSVVMMGVQSKLATDYLIGVEASPVNANQAVNLSRHDSIYSELLGKNSKNLMEKLLASASRIPAKGELDRLHAAVESLKKKNLISEENSLMVNEFIDSGNLKFVS